MENNVLEKDFEFFVNNLEKLNEQYGDKFVVIKNCSILAAYDDYAIALETTLKTHELGTFLIQKVGNTPNSFTLYLNRFSVVI